MHVDEIGATQFLRRNDIPHGCAERFRAATGQRVEPRVAQRGEHVGATHLLDARDVRDLDRRQRLDVHLRMPRLERAEHRRVVLEPRLHVEAADDVELARDRAVGPIGFGEHLVERVAIRALFLGQACIPAEGARRAQDADVGGIDVLVGRERHAVAVTHPVGGIGHRTDPQQIGRPEERDPVGNGEALPGDQLFADRKERRITQSGQIERHSKRHQDVPGRWRGGQAARHLVSRPDDPIRSTVGARSRRCDHRTRSCWRSRRSPDGPWARWG